eukprot:1776070-Rhodomonas_salina.1
MGSRVSSRGVSGRGSRIWGFSLGGLQLGGFGSSRYSALDVNILYGWTTRHHVSTGQGTANAYAVRTRHHASTGHRIARAEIPRSRLSEGHRPGSSIADLSTAYCTV